MAPYANVPTRPTNSSNALNERFIVFLLRVIRDFPGDGKPLRICIIQPVRPKLSRGRETRASVILFRKLPAQSLLQNQSGHGTPRQMRLRENPLM
jgi:hypothetical protein